MKKLIILLALVLSAHAYSENHGVYFSGKVGPAVSIPEGLKEGKTYDPGLFSSVAIGYKILAMRFEVEGATMHFDATRWMSDNINRFDININLNNWLAMFNTYHDFHLSRGFHPYIGAGLGGMWSATTVSRMYENGDILGFNTSSSPALMYQMMAGFKLSPTPKFAVIAEYRAIQDSKKTPGDLYGHVLSFSLNRQF